MAFQANQPDFLPHQHSRIVRPVRLMACPAAFKPHGRMLERKRTALVTMATQAPRLIRGERLPHGFPRGSVRIVAIHTGHRVLRHLVAKRFLKLRHHIGMAGRTLRVYLRLRASHQPHRPVRMNRVARRAGNRVFHVTALNAPVMRRLVQMAAQTDLVRLLRNQLFGIPDLRRVS